MKPAHPAVVALLLLATVAAGELYEPPASQPADGPTVQWGESRAGLRLSAMPATAPAVGRELPIDVILHNNGSVAVNLPPLEPAFAWATVVYSRSKGLMTEKLSPVPQTPWPASLAPGATIRFKSLPLQEAQVYAFEHAKDLLTAYVGGDSPKAKPLGPLSEQLSAGACKLRITLYLPRKDEPALAVASATLDLQVAPPDLDSLGAQQRKAFLDDLRKQFHKDEWAGQQAHNLAVQMGPAVVPELIDAVTDAKAPPFARMWLTTALADIRDERAADALVSLLEDDSAGVRACVAYHGVKQRSQKLDKAIVAKVLAAGEPKLTAYALVGFMAHRGDAPAELLRAGLQSDDARVQSAVRSALKNYASDYNVARLRKLAADKDAPLAATAQEMLKAMGQSATRPTTQPDTP